MKNPFRRKNPYITRGVVPEKLSSQTTPLGFLDTLKGDYDKLRKDVKSVWDRLRYRYSAGEPAAYIGGKIYEPQSDIVNLDIFQDGSPTVPVNIVIGSGQQLQVPITLEGPGVFVARSMVVSLYQRFHDPVNGEQWVPLPYGRNFFNVDDTSAQGTDVQTIKWSLMHDLTNLISLVFSSVGQKLYGTNFLWNITDADSGRQLADDLIPDQALFPQGWQGQQDGQIYHFATPWLFERANTVSFKFQMINDVLQLDPSAVVFPVNGVDDREKNGSVRNQAVKVRIELHGTKHYNDRDMLLREAS